MRKLKVGLLPTGTYWGSTASAPFLEAFKGLRCAVVKASVHKSTRGSLQLKPLGVGIRESSGITRSLGFSGLGV